MLDGFNFTWGIKHPGSFYLGFTRGIFKFPFHVLEHFGQIPVVPLKVHKHEMILNFFDLNQILICPSIHARISMFEHFRGDWAYGEPNFFFDELSKKILFKIFTLVLLGGFLDGFWKFLLFIVKICILIWYFWVFFEKL